MYTYRRRVVGVIEPANGHHLVVSVKSLSLILLTLMAREMLLNIPLKCSLSTKHPLHTLFITLKNKCEPSTTLITLCLSTLSSKSMERRPASIK
jgi:hypothetical protein